MGRDLLASLGWAVFVGAGIALGLYLGSLGADVPADTGMLALTAVVAFSATLIARVLMILFTYRPGKGISAQATTPEHLAPIVPGTAKGEPERGAPAELDEPTPPATGARRRRTSTTSRSRSSSGSGSRSGSRSGRRGSPVTRSTRSGTSRSGTSRSGSTRAPSSSSGSTSSRKATPRRRRPLSSTDDDGPEGES